MPYENAPLVFVALEIRYPSENSAGSPTLEDQRDLRSHLDEVASSDGESWVVDQLKPAPTFQLAIGPTGPGTQQGGVLGISGALPRLMNRPRTMAVTFAPTALIVETTDYRSWDHFQLVVEPVVSFVAERLHPDGYRRLGMRYLDEIAIPHDGGAPLGWGPYLASALPHPPPRGFVARSWQSVVQYFAEGDRGVILRYGPTENPVLDPGNGLRRRPVASGSLLSIDTDAFVQPSTIPTFDPASILRTLDGLHVPVSELFESLVTDTLRKLWN